MSFVMRIYFVFCFFLFLLASHSFASHHSVPGMHDHSQGCDEYCNRVFNELFVIENCPEDEWEENCEPYYNHLPKPESFKTEEHLRTLRYYLWNMEAHYDNEQSHNSRKIPPLTNIESCKNYLYVKDLVDKNLGKKKRNSADLKAIEKIKTAINELIKKTREALKKKLEKYKELLDSEKDMLSVIDKPLSEIDTELLENTYPKWFVQTILEAKAKEAELQEELQKKIKELENKKAELLKKAEDTLTDSGVEWSTINLDNLGLDSIPEVSLSGIEEDISDFEDDTSHYKAYADQIIQRLQDFWESRDRISFVEVIYAWQENHRRLEPLLQSRVGLIKGEWNDYQKHHNRIVFTMRQYMDDDLYFHSSNIPQSTKDSIEKVITKASPELASELKKAVNELEGQESERKERTLKSIDDIAIGYDEFPEEKSFWDSLTQSVTVFIKEKMPIVKQEAECLAKSLAAGSYSDYYELRYGKSFCSDEDLSTVDMLLSASNLGMSGIGWMSSGPLGGNLGEKLGKSFKFLKNVFTKFFQRSPIGNKIKTKTFEALGIFDSARKLGFSSKEKMNKLKEWLKKPLISGDAGSIRWKTDVFVDLSSEARRKHILFGDATGGGHMFPGKPGKTIFPKNWGGDKIMHEVADIITDPKLKWKQTNGVPGTLYTRAGKPAKFEVVGIREGVEIKIVFKPANNEFVTAHPISGPGVVKNP